MLVLEAPALALRFARLEALAVILELDSTAATNSAWTYAGYYGCDKPNNTGLFCFEQ